MTPRERLLAALRREVPDRVPASVHQWQPYHLDKYLGGMDALDAFKHFGLDAAIPCLPLVERQTPQWRMEVQELTGPDGYCRKRTLFHTPEGTLSETWEKRPCTWWIVEHRIKHPEDVALLDKYQPVPAVDHAAISREYDRVGDAGILRGFVIGIQGGCWQDAVELYGLKDLILATRRDPAWVHYFLTTLLNKKLRFIFEELAGARLDLIETGGGSASSTCISPKLHATFCTPYDRQMHDALHAIGLPVVYHTCGGMMPLLDLIVANGCDASETLTPPTMGGDARPAELKARIGDRVCLIGGINQAQILDCGTPADVRAHVRDLFAAYGPGGGYIMSPSDHFFETPPENLAAYAAAARECTY